MYLALRNITVVDKADPNWSATLSQFVILFERRVPMGGIGSNSLTQTA
jgi:hypothetical protein